MAEKPKAVEKDPFEDLEKSQNTKRKVAIIVAFAGVFVWFVKVMFL